jgi:1,3-beta-glucan synthase
LVDVPPSQRFLKFDKIEWHRAFFKTYYESRSFFHLLVNFNRIWVLHVSVFWYYTAFNSQNIYTLEGEKRAAHAAVWSAVALGGAISTLIMIFATAAEFSYVPTTWNNSSHLMRRMLFLLVVLALTIGPSIYIFFVAKPRPADDAANAWNTPVILGIVQFAIAITATILFSVVPSGRMFGDRVAGKARKYLASQTFTASYPKLSNKARWASVLLWVLVFGCKFAESYFFLTLSFKNPIRAMVGMRIQNCEDKLFGSNLCRYQANFTLAVMFFMASGRLA